jgi:hypothetical protein
MQTTASSAGGFRFVNGVFQYSAGVAALPGFRIVRVRFRALLPLLEGLRRAEQFIVERGRPIVAFCACELRSPAQFTEQGFQAFNKTYVDILEGWGLYDGGRNPVARSNVCPANDPPEEVSLHAFAFTVPATTPERSFIVSGSAEAPEGRGSYRDYIVRSGDISPDGIREKARFVLDEIARRLRALRVGWDDTTATQIYTVHDIYPLLAQEIVEYGAGRSGLTWHFCRPPVEGLEFEMDCRGLTEERMVEV